MRRILFIALAITVLCAQPALAATGTMEVTATFRTPTSVAINSVSDMIFGTYDPLLTTDLDAASTVNITSSPSGRSYEIFTSLGSNPSGGQRQITQSTPYATLNYNLYRDAGRLIPIPDAPGVAGAWYQVTTGGAVDVTLYGRIPAQQSAPDGTYSDTVTVYVFYTP